MELTNYICRFKKRAFLKCLHPHLEMGYNTYTTAANCVGHFSLDGKFKILQTFRRTPELCVGTDGFKFIESSCNLLAVWKIKRVTSGHRVCVHFTQCCSTWQIFAQDLRRFEVAHLHRTARIVLLMRWVAHTARKNGILPRSSPSNSPTA